MILAYRGHEVRIIQQGILLCLVEYVHLFLHLPRIKRQFRVRTEDIMP